MLDNVRVLDVTQVVAGSFASMTLGDMGAEVIKIERPDGGDVGRQSPPFVGDFSAYFASVNRDKKSVSLNLKSDRGRDIFLDLARTADVIVENFKPGAMEAFGLDYETVAEHNSEIVYCSISGFGQTGPYADYPALDIIAQAMSGNMSITGPPDDQPYRSGIPIADIAGSMYAVQGVLGALYERRETGEGQHIDVSMLDGILSWLTVRAGHTFATGKPYPRLGNKLDAFVPYGVFETADSYLAVVVVQGHHWEKLCAAIDRPELADDERFDTPEKRRENRDELEAALEQALIERTTDEWFDVMAEYDVPAGPIYDTKEVWDDEHVQSRGLLSEIELDGEQFPVIGNPVKYSKRESEAPEGVARVGEHTRATLQSLGYDDDEIEEFIDNGIVGSTNP